ncbi:MAG TPA: protein kinase [Thermoanaerobaculia bacterium]|nr:protein kinase [Thermoanaerobaculia bacterium]
MTLSAGSRLGPYEIVAPLGAGGMGEVYRARDTRLERTVAIKVLSSHLSASPEVRQRFEREAKTISQLSHPHICALHDVGREGDVEYLVMEYLEGETLADRLLKGPLPLEQTLRYGIQIADALDKAHRQGVVHRDLKPGNVMLTKTGVKLLDFGLAKVLSPARSTLDLTSFPTQAAPVTREGTLLGTVQYMAPEQLEGKDADARTDIFAFGCVLYEMATGKKAFSGSTQASLISSILRDEPQPISQVQPTSPPAFDHVVKKSLAKDPEDRWQNAADLGGELKWIAEAGSQTGATAVAPQRRRRRDWLAWVAAGLLLLTTLFLGNEVRRLRSGDRVRAIHSYLDPPEKTTFRLTGDDSAPIAIAPDGTRAVFGAGGKLWLQSLAAGTVTPLAATDGGRFPFWSPDSRSIGFFSGGKLRVLDASGGPVQTICGAPNPRGGSWGRSGVIVFAPDVGTGLSRVAASGGSPAPLTVLTDRKKHTTHRWPYFLPDGKHVLYLAANHASPRSEDNGIYVASLDGGAPRRLMSSYGSAQYASGWLLSVRERSLMAIPFDAKRIEISGQPVRVADDANFDSGVWRGTFAASENGVLGYQIAREGGGGRLTWLDFSGRHLAPVAEKSPAYSPEMSPDGRRASVVMGDPNNDVWVYELDRGVQTRLTTDAEAQIAPVWSPDGSQIVFVQGLGGGSDFLLVTIAADGAGRQKEIYRSKERLEVSDWSRDGRYLLVDRGNIGASDIWAFPIADPAKAFPLVQSPFLEHSGQFSPDGKWVAYVSQHTGRDEVYVASFPSGGTRWQVSGSGGTQPRWSADGRELYFVSSSDDLTATAVDGSGPRFVVKDVRPLFRVNMYTGPRSGMYGYDVAPDGKRFLVNDAGEAGQARVALVVNWTAELK